MFIIYRARFENGKSYIGFTSKTLEQRKNRHFSRSRYELTDAPFYRALRKYNYKTVWSIIDKTDTKEKAQKLEIYYIKQYNTFASNKQGYNATRGGEGAKGLRHTEETKNLISKQLKGRTPWNKGKKGLQKAWNRGKKGLQKAWNEGTRPFNVFLKDSEELIGTWCSHTKCAEELGLIRSGVSRCLSNTAKSHKGYIFKYVEEQQC